MKPLYIVGTGRNVGKTTLILGLVQGLYKRGLNVAYLKPLGQHFSGHGERLFHDDAHVVARLLQSSLQDAVNISMPLGRGRVEQEMKQLNPDKHLAEIAADVEQLQKKYDVVILEGMGNVAMGACLGLSAADVARRLGARTMLVVEGGIGRTIDESVLCTTYLRACQTDLMGVVISKVWPTKYERISNALCKRFPELGIDCFGFIPFQEELACPVVEQVYKGLEGELLGGGEHLAHRVQNTIIGAMKGQNMSRYISTRTLVITPGDRSDVIIACLRAHLIGGEESLAVSGLVLTCGHRPDAEVVELIRQNHLPCILVDGDTYSVASELRSRIYKITPDDKERISLAAQLVSKHADIDRILAGLQK